MPDYGFTFINSNTDSTYGQGINDAGDVVGSVFGNGGDHGFTYINGSLSLVDYPGSNLQTILSGVSATGNLVGYYLQNGFLAFKNEGGAAGTFQQIPTPGGASSIFAYGISPNSNTVVGAYQEGRYTLAYTLTGGHFQSFAYPGYGTSVRTANETIASGVNDAGEIVGSYGSGSQQGFTDLAGNFSTLNFPNATSTSINGINDMGDLVGSYTSADGVQHGFMYFGQTFTSIDVPGAADTTISGINNRGQLVGTESIAGGGARAFVATPVLCFVQNTRIRMRDGLVPIEEIAIGDIAITASGEHRAIRWLGHRLIDCRHHHCPNEIYPILTSAHAFGEDHPMRDLYLSPGHPVLVGADADNEGGYLVPIMCLVNGTTIRRVPVERVIYWHIELETHDILLAEDLPAESYLDWGDRPFFSEGAGHRLANPDFVVPGLIGRCRPVAVDGPVVERARRRLDAFFQTRLSVAAAWPCRNDGTLEMG